MPTITDATVVAQAYDTSGNGGRKLVRLDNGNLYSVMKNSTSYFIQKSTDGTNWSSFKTATYTTVQDVCLSTNGKYIYVAISFNNSSFGVIGFDESGNVISSVSIDNVNQTALDNVSLAINEAKTELSAAWASKNSTYPNNYNIRYAKGTISQVDGTVSWNAVEQVTVSSTAGVDLKNPSITINKNGFPVIVFEQSYSNAYTIYAQIKDATGWYVGSDTSYRRGYTVYSGGSTYAQSSPSAIFVPQSINGLGSGLIANAWHGTDSASGGANYIRFSKSTDGGVTWSTALKLVVGTNATLTANKSGKLFITYEDAGVTKRIESTDNGDTWSSAITVGTGTNPSSLFDLAMNMTAPLTIRKGTSSVLFTGTWTVTTISVAPGDIGQIQDKNNILSYSITTDGEMSTITEKINGTVVNTRTANSGQAVMLGLTQAQWDAIRFGKYADATGGKNTLTVEMGTEKWTYTFDKRLATDADILSATKAVKDTNEVYLPSQINRLAEVAKGKGAVIPANPKIDDIVDGIKNSANGKVLSGVVTSSSTVASYEYLGSTLTNTAASVTVTGLTFKPKRIIIKPQNLLTDGRQTEYIYGLMGALQPEQVFISLFGSTNPSGTNYGYKADKNGLYVNSTGFVLPVMNGSTVYEWTAYEK